MGQDLGAARIAIALFDRVEFTSDFRQQQRVRTQNGAQPPDLGDQLGVLLLDLLALESGQSLQAHVEDRLRLGLGQGEVQGESHPGLRRRAAGADRGDHLVQMIESDEQTLDHMGPLFRPGQLVAAAPDDDRAAMVQEVAQQVVQAQDLGLVVDDRQHVHAVADLELGHLVEGVQDDLGHLAPLQVDHDADAVAVGLVAQIADALELLLTHQFGDPFDQPRFVHLVGNLGDDDRLPVRTPVLDVGARAHLNRTASRLIGATDARATVDEPSGREVRPGDELDQLVQ